MSSRERFQCLECGLPAHMAGIDNPYHDDPAMDEDHTAIDAAEEPYATGEDWEASPTRRTTEDYSAGVVPNTPLDDPNYPHRPSHPDFARLTEIILELDAGVGDKMRVDPSSLDVEREGDELLGSVADPGSVAYVALQRSLRVISAEGGFSAEDWLRSTALYLEAFIVGCRYHERYGKETSGSQRQNDS